MERKTALSAAAAFTLTAVAAVSALFFTMSAGADTNNEPTTPVVAEPEVVTEYEVVQVEVATDGSEADAGGDASMAAVEDDELPEDDEDEGEEHPEEDEGEDEDDEDEDDD